jgi:hypothetical protein
MFIIPLFSIVQAIATLVAGLIVGLIFIWKLGLVGLGTFPWFLFSSIASLTLTTWRSMCPFSHVNRLHSFGTGSLIHFP